MIDVQDIALDWLVDWRLTDELSFLKIPSDEFHWTAKPQAITSANVDPDLCGHTAHSHNEFIS